MKVSQEDIEWLKGVKSYLLKLSGLTPEELLEHIRGDGRIDVDEETVKRARI